MERKIIDIHAHMGVSFNAWSDEYPTIDELIKEYEFYGVVKACMSSWLIIYDPRKGNKEIYEYTKKYPDHLVGVAAVSPRLGKSTVEEIDRCINDYAFKGLKIHPTAMQFYADSHLINPVMEKAIEYDVPILFHSEPDQFSNVRLLRNLAKRYPSAKIIIGHMSFSDWLEAIFVAKENDNVYLDTTNCVTEFLALLTAIRECGPDKLLWGSDSPGLNIGAELAKVTEARKVSEDTKKKILYGNAIKLFKL